jgi:hypothetical protein
MSLFDELEAAVAAVTDRIGTATVAIGRDRRGTGVVIADGRVLTNAHNLRDRRGDRRRPGAHQRPQPA